MQTVSVAEKKNKAQPNCAQIPPIHMQDVRQIIQQIFLSYHANAVSID